MFPPAKIAIINPAAAGPTILARFQHALLNAIALKMSSSPTTSGIKAVRAGIDNASTVPFRNPIVKKAEKSAMPENIIKAINKVAIPFINGAHPMISFLANRSAKTPPNSEKTTCGIIKESVTQVNLIAEEVIS